MRDTLTRDETVKYNSIKSYRGEKDYEKLFRGDDYKLIKKLNGPTRNIWCSIYYRLPRALRDNLVIFKFFKSLISLTIFVDFIFINKKEFKRHKKSNQLFYVFSSE
jgi:hypothetical protein